MIYITLNVGGLLDPMEELIMSKYSSDSRVTLSKLSDIEEVSDEPFFSDRWLLIMNSKVLKEKEALKTLFGKGSCDYYIRCYLNDDYNITLDRVNQEVSKIFKSVLSNHKYNEFLKDTENSETEVKEYISELKNIYPITSYNLSDKYLESYIKWILYFKGNSDCDFIEAWKNSKNYIPTTLEQYFISSIISRVKGNERDIRNILELNRHRELNTELINSICKQLPERTYVTLNNFMISILHKDSKNRKEVINLLYNCKNPKYAVEGALEICNRYLKIHKEFKTGKLTKSNRLSWVNSNGKAFNIKSEYMVNKWLDIIHLVSYETIYSMKIMLETKSYLESYSTLMKMAVETL